MTIRELLDYGVRELEGFTNPLLDVRLLLMYVTGLNKVDVMISLDKEVSEEKRIVFIQLVKKRKEYCPIAYLIGEKEFYARSFFVKRGVLIPRADTELLVESVLEKIEKSNTTTGFEVGVGSGAISITLLCERPKLVMTASDIEDIPIEVSKKNAVSYEVQDRFHLCHCSLFDKMEEREFDFIVSNPPYISFEEKTELMRDVVDYEPHSALFGGKDGLFYYRSIVKEGRKYLKDGGFFAFEIGCDQAQAVTEICSAYGLQDILVKQDLAGKDRVVIATKREGKSTFE